MWTNIFFALIDKNRWLGTHMADFTQGGEWLLKCHYFFLRWDQYFTKKILTVNSQLLSINYGSAEVLMIFFLGLSLVELV